GIRQQSFANKETIGITFEKICAEFAGARPTAINLCWAIDEMTRAFRSLIAITASAIEIQEGLLQTALTILTNDIKTNEAIGKNGQTLVADGDNILTHCNAGALACAGYGTALGVLRAAKDAGKKFSVYVDETRPVLQGARLTAWELLYEGISATLICDNMAGALMAEGRVNKIITGADRIARNGDTANKIGTYSLAVLANAHGIPFYIAAPLSTFDVSIPDGSHIPIEERSANEITHINSQRIAPENIRVYNPAFDVTPARLITAIVTENGIIRPPFTNAIATFYEGKG
ncbi:MAG: S-methyl-5-thioribose-1-phosphate isomerase, partial [Deltaproteobacteria bacterium]